MRAIVPGARIGELVDVEGHGLQAEIVGFRGDEAVLMPLGDPAGIGPASTVTATGTTALDRGFGGADGSKVLDGLGRPIDGGGPIAGGIGGGRSTGPRPIRWRAGAVTRPLALGIRALDGLLTVGEGQRMGVFAGSGVGKSTLMGQIARQTEADVNVIALVGERGREVRDFLDGVAGPGRALRSSVVVCATSDAPSLVRLKAAFVATAIAEYFRDAGRRVLFMLDSVTRVARAQREVGLAAGEPPARQRYPPSVFALLPRLLEQKTGNDARSSRSRRFTPCWSRAATWTNRSPTRCAASWTGTSCCRGRSPPATTGPRSTCCNRCPA